MDPVRLSNSLVALVVGIPLEDMVHMIGCPLCESTQKNVCIIFCEGKEGAFFFLAIVLLEVLMMRWGSIAIDPPG